MMDLEISKKGLESNTLPMILNLVGGALGGLSWLTTTDWFKSLFDENYTYTDVEETTQLINKPVQDN